jgi:RimJ/RimL family protein N-acetyltransferase
MHFPTVETDHLTLRGFVPDDLDRLAVILSDPGVMRYMPGGKPLPRERAEKTLQNILHHWEQRGFGWWAVICHADARLIGWCGLGFVDELAETEVAYLLDSPYWRRGYATEAARASLRYGFEELQLERIIALAHTENIASRRVMEKNGMAYEKELHLWDLDLAQYAITWDAFRPGEAAYTLQGAKEK